MLVQLSEEIQREVEAAVRVKLGNSLVVNVYETAEEIRLKHAAAADTLDDIAASIAKLAAQRGCAVELGKDTASAHPRP